MKNISETGLNRFRIREGDLASEDKDGNNGVFVIPHPSKADTFLQVVASDGTEPDKDGKPTMDIPWEHISVVVLFRKRRKKAIKVMERTPEWAEMHWAKLLFFEAEEACYQLHPPQSDYVNTCPHALHIWRNKAIDVPLPPKEFV